MRELKCLRIAKALLHTAVISAVYMLMSICLAAVPSAGLTCEFNKEFEMKGNGAIVWSNPLARVAALAFIGINFLSAYGITSEDVWTEFVKNPYNHPNIPNNSFSGYHQGEIPLPNYPVVVDATKLGAKGDGSADNSAAIANAIEAAFLAGGGAVYLPEGTYKVNGYIHLKYNGVVLRGAGQGKTIIQFTRPCEQLMGKRRSHTGTSEYSWLGGLITVAPSQQLLLHGGLTDSSEIQNQYAGVAYADDHWAWYSGYSVPTTVASWREASRWIGNTVAKVTNNPNRGSFTVDIDDPSKVVSGGYYTLSWLNNARITNDISLFQTLAGHELMKQYPWDESGARTIREKLYVQYPVQIVAKSGNTIIMSSTTRVDVKQEWAVELQNIGPYVEEIGVEDMTLQMIGAPAKELHLQNAGYNGVYFTKAINCWSRNVEITDAENGIFLRSVSGISLTGIKLNGSVWMHHAIACANTHNSILENFELKAGVMHGLNVESLTAGMVFRNGQMDHGTFDSHRNMPYDVIRTNIVMANDGRPGGDPDFGPFCGKNMVHWNLKITSDDNTGKYVNQPDAHSMGALVGVHGSAQNDSCAWGMVCGNKGNIIADAGKEPAIKDLFEKQVELRASMESWVRIAYPLCQTPQPGPTQVLIAANAGGATVSKVELLVDGITVGSSSSAPYKISWNAAAGDHELVANMIDSKGAKHVSYPVKVFVGYRLKIEDTDPALRYSGTPLKTEKANMSGGTMTRINKGSVSFSFMGTGFDAFSTLTKSLSQTWVVSIDGGPETSTKSPTSNENRGRVLSVSGLSNGMHTVKISTTNSIIIDYLIVMSSDKTLPPPTAVEPVYAAVNLTPSFALENGILRLRNYIPTDKIVIMNLMGKVLERKSVAEIGAGIDIKASGIAGQTLLMGVNREGRTGLCGARIFHPLAK